MHAPAYSTSRHTLIETAECEIETVTVDEARALRGDEAVGACGIDCTTPWAHRSSAMWVRRLASVGGAVEAPASRKAEKGNS
jgi:hypothetical protein